MKVRYLLAFTLVAVAIVASCGKKDGNHAPVCPYGQVLIYNDSGYNCQFVSLSQPQAYGYQQYNNTSCGQTNATGTYVPPIQQCGVDPADPQPQTLVNWYGTWLCYKNKTLYPSGDNSPFGRTPPPGVGGEFCTAGYGSAYSQAYLGYGYNSYAGAGGCGQVSCSPGFVCQPQAQGTTGTTNYSTFGGSYGTPGTCVYQGYHGSY